LISSIFFHSLSHNPWQEESSGCSTQGFPPFTSPSKIVSMEQEEERTDVVAFFSGFRDLPGGKKCGLPGDSPGT